MSVQAEAWVERYSPFTGSTYTVHRALAEIVNEERGYRFYGQLTRLAKKTRLGRKTITNAIQELAVAGFLKTLRPAMLNRIVDGEAKQIPTGKPGIYRFVFVPDLPVAYDGQGGEMEFLDPAEQGGASIDAPPKTVESHVGFSAGPRAESDTDPVDIAGGASFDARQLTHGVRHINPSGASYGPVGCVNRRANSRELEGTQEKLQSAPAAADAPTDSTATLSSRAEIFDSLVVVFGPASTASRQSFYGSVVTELLAIDPTPTDVEVIARGQRCRERYPDASPAALVKHWDALALFARAALDAWSPSLDHAPDGYSNPIKSYSDEWTCTAGNADCVNGLIDIGPGVAERCPCIDRTARTGV